MNRRMITKKMKTLIAAQSVACGAAVNPLPQTVIAYAGFSSMWCTNSNRSPVCRWLCRSAALLLGCVAIAISATAQINGAGAISGTVADSSAAAIPGATVIAANIATGVKTSRTSTNAGLYILSPLQPGDYSLTISAAGFQTLIQKSIHVNAQETVGFNATLKVGSETQQVVVTGAPPSINVSTPSMTYTLPSEAYEALPVGMTVGTSGIGRDPLHFVALLPGVTGYGNFSSGTIMGLPLQSGGSGHAEEVYVEGVPLSNGVLQGEARDIQVGLNIEAIDQFQLEGAGASPQFFGNGATNMTLKSGTNNFHGSIYEYFRNTVLDAKPYFATTRSPEKRNEFGGSIGGPIMRDKLFFFASVNDFQQRTASNPTFFTVPTLKERQGDFSELSVPIYDPATTDCSTGTCTRTPFPNNIIPQNRLSSSSQFLQNNGSPNPLPTPQNSGIQNNFLSSNPENFSAFATTEKVDWAINSAHSLSFMFSRGSQHNVDPGPYSLATLPYPYGDGRDIATIGTILQLKHTWVISAHLVNQAALGYNRLWVPIRNVTIGGDWMNKAGVTGLPAGEASSAFPVISFSGSNSPTGWRGGNSPAFNEAGNNTTFLDNLSWDHGKHAIVVGAQTQWMSENVTNNTSGSNATWGFSSNQTAGFNKGTLQAATGNAYASFLLGGLSSNTVNDYAVTQSYPRFRDYSWWAQDTYKATPRLSLDFGLRYDYRTPWKDERDHMSWLNPTLSNPAIGGFPGALEFAGNGVDSCHCHTNLDAWHDGFGPRVGLAYSITPTTVIRAGYQMTYTYNNNQNARSGTGLLGYVASPAFSSPDTFTPAYYWQNGVPSYQKAPFFDPTLNTGYNTITGANGGAITWGNPRFAARPPRFQNFNLTIQHSFTPSLMLEVAYVGSNAHGLNGGSVISLAGAAIGQWSNQIAPSYLVLGNLLTASATSANIAKAQAIVPGIKLPYPNFVGSISQMLRPFPQYSSLTAPWTNNGNALYDSLQIIVKKSMSHGLLLNGNLVWSKSMSDELTNRTAYTNQWALVNSNPAWLLHIIATYQLPFGKGKAFTGGGRAVQAIAGGWEMSGVGTYQSGTVFGPIGANCTLPNAGSCYASFNPAFNGPVRINGKYGSRGTSVPYLDKNAFISPAAYTYGNTSPMGAADLRGPETYAIDLNVRREFQLRESMVLRFQADALNAFNFMNFAAPNQSIASASFGLITAQANSPRVVQFAARILF